jgi:hypothetical protein
VTSARGDSRARRPGDRLVVAGALLFAVGLVATVATVTPFLVGADPLPVAAYLLAGLAPLGLGVALLGLLAQASGFRAARRGRAQRHD